MRKTNTKTLQKRKKVLTVVMREIQRSLEDIAQVHELECFSIDFNWYPDEEGIVTREGEIAQLSITYKNRKKPCEFYDYFEIDGSIHKYTYKGSHPKYVKIKEIPIR